MSTRKFLSLFLPSKPKTISSPETDTKFRLKRSVNETKEIEALNSVLTNPLIRSAFLKACINRGDQKSAIFILMMQQFKKAYDGLSSVKANSIHYISVRIKEEEKSKNTQAQEPKTLSRFMHTPSYFKNQTVEEQSYDSFLSSIDISDQQRDKIVKDLQDGRVKNAFDDAYATVCAALLGQNKVSAFIDQMVSESKRYTPRGNNETYIRQLAEDLQNVGFDTKAMGLYL